MEEGQNITLQTTELAEQSYCFTYLLAQIQFTNYDDFWRCKRASNGINIEISSHEEASFKSRLLLVAKAKHEMVGVGKKRKMWCTRFM